jgi:uncharacterized protein (DUF2141 family)
MKTIFVTIALLGVALAAQAQAPTPVAAPNYTLTVDIEQVRVTTGTVFVALQNPSEKAVQRQAVPLTDKAVKVVFRNVTPGQYAVRFFVDENGNRELDKGIFGVPKESWGCSNDVKASFGPPKFEAMLFPLAADKTIVLHAR